MTNLYTPSNTTKYQFYTVSPKPPSDSYELRMNIARKISIQLTKPLLFTVKKMNRDISTLVDDSISKEVK